MAKLENRFLSPIQGFTQSIEKAKFERIPLTYLGVILNRYSH